MIESRPNQLLQTLRETINLLEQPAFQQTHLPRNTEELYTLCRLAQSLTTRLRRIYRESHPLDDETLQNRLRSQGYICSRDENKVYISLPLLLPMRGGDTDFITVPLIELLSLKMDYPKFLAVTILVQQIYNSEHPVRNVRDSDNLEYRVVQNILERFLLTSDSSLCCTTIHTSSFGAADRTVIRIFNRKLIAIDLEGVFNNETLSKEKSAITDICPILLFASIPICMPVYRIVCKS